MKQLQSTNKGLLLIALTIIGLIFSGTWEGVPAEDVAPTIEELTDGKIKVGDLVTKENVDLVKEHLPVHVYELVKQGLVMEMGEHLAPWATVPKFYQEVTKQNHKQYGNPVINENGAIYTKDGKPWPGGIPFLEPATALEVTANIKYDRCMDDFSGFAQFKFVNKEGKPYKTMVGAAEHAASEERLTIPPLGSVPGREGEFYRNIIVFTHPLEVKGTGQLQIKHWDDTKNPDKGFAYVSAFKRVIRISATTYQDNMGGGDFTWGDPGGGYLEPFSYWQWKLVGKKNILTQQPFGEAPILEPDGDVNITLPYDVGIRFPRDKWVIRPVYVIEGTPTIKHCYGKRVFHVAAPAYSNCWLNGMGTDFYDRQMALWKGYNKNYSKSAIRDEPYSFQKSQLMYDLQTNHQTLMHEYSHPHTAPKPEALTLKALIGKGR